MYIKKIIIKNIKYIIARWSNLHTIIIFFLFIYLIAIFKLFSYTFFDYDFYKGLADNQQIGKFVVPVNRGTIYSSIERENSNSQKLSVLATSVNFYDLSIDPTMEGNKIKLGNFLVDLVYKEKCGAKNITKKQCKENIHKFLKKVKIEDFQNNEEFIKKLLKNYIFAKISKTKLESVSLGNEFTKEQIEEVKSLNIVGIYPRNTSIYVNPEEFSYTEHNIVNLSKILFINKERLKYLTKKRKLKYIPILKKLSIDNYEKLRNFREEEQGAIRRTILDKKESISNFFILEPRPSRYYPESNIGSQIIGFVDGDGIGHYGIEGYFNDILKGNNGQIISKRDVIGNIITTISGEKEDWRGEGVEIITTMDRNIQDKIEGILAEGVKKFMANKGSIVVMEPKTGKILAMANYPTYNLNNYSDVYELEKINNEDFPNPEIDLAGYPIFVVDTLEGKKTYYDNKEIYLREANDDELVDNTLIKYRYKNWYGAGVYKNDAISSLYEPGSIMKAITVAMGIDSGEIKPNTTYNDTGKVVIDNFKIVNVDQEKCMGYKTFQNALNFSCNVGMVRISQKLGRVLQYQYLRDFGFNEKTGINLEGEVSSEIDPWEKISIAKLFTRSYGLGISVTPLQMATAYSILANGGVYTKPKIIEKIIYSDGREQIFKTEKLNRVIKETTSKTITKMLYQSAELGFAKGGKVEGYSIAGKTGTAEINYKGKYKTGIGWTNASYAGYGPVEDPKFVIIVKLERPRTNVYGSQTSAILFSEVASYLFDYFGIPKNKN